MKKDFQTPVAEIVLLEKTDVIVTSDCPSQFEEIDG